MMQIDSLVDYNKIVLHEKIAAVKSIRNTYRADDLINVLSSAPDRDKGIINNFEKDEVLIRRIQCKGVLRMVRFFTMKGVARYLHEGRVFSYKNACSFFNIEPRDLEKEKLVASLNSIKELDGTYNTKKLLKWLFEKRKSAKQLGDSCTLSKMLEFVDTLHEDDMMSIPDTKLALLRSFDI